MRPPLRAVLAYRLLDRRPDPRYDDWLRADLDSRWYPIRATAHVLLAFGLIVLALAMLGWISWPVAITGVVGGSSWAVAGTRRSRSRMRDRFFPPPPDLGPWLPYQGAEPEGS